MCTVSGCERPHLTRGLCSGHRHRVDRYGDPMVDIPLGQKPHHRVDIEVRFMAKVDKQENGCWLWTSSRQSNGYSRFAVDRRWVPGHRWAYERWVGPIPAGMHLDHFRCDTPLCVNPTHVRPVTPARELASRHPYDGVNGDGERICRTCRRAGERRRRSVYRKSRAKGLAA